MEGNPQNASGAAVASDASVASEEPRALDAAALQAQRRLTYLRFLVTAVSSCIFPFLGTPDTPSSARWAGYALLASGWIQSLAALAYEPVLRRSARVSARIGIATESALTLVWVYATGGVESPWLVAIYGAIVWVSLHRRPRDTLLSALICGAGYVVMAVLLGQLAGHELVVGVRVLYMFVIAASAAVISRERLTRLTSRIELLDLTQQVGQIGTWEWSVADNTVTWSEELHRLFGVPRSYSPTFESYVAALHPDDRAYATAIIQQALADGKPFRFDHRIVTSDGTVRSLHCRGRVLTDANGVVTDMVGSAQDVTERKKMEAQLVTAGKLASLGTLASGVAHEINNPLAYVASNLELIDRQLEQLEVAGKNTAPLKSLREAVSAARHGSARMRDIVQGLKTFSRPDEESKQLIDLARVADLAIEVASHQITQRARVVRDFAPTPRVLANESRLAQVFMNLLVNAAQAIERGTVDENEIRVRIYEATDGSACVEVSDSGCGVAPEDLERIFDPFFTTKATGDGTGLGLSICHGIVRELGGEIRVTQTSAAGTTFRVSLPLADARSKPEPEPEEKRTVSEPVRRAGPPRRKICIIDDEERYARSLRLLLEDEYDVTLSPSAAHATALLEKGADYDVILCDLMMPGKTGMDLYDEMAGGGCDVRDRIVFVTGGPTNERARAFLARPGIRHAEKPLELERLQALIEEVATRSRSAA